MQKLPRIFIAIASYRDLECQYTVRDAFAKATHPERISVGICWQYDAAQDQDCFLVPAPYPQQVREIRFYAQDSKGAGWARSQAFSLMKDEEFALQIDAHMRFAPGWDVALLELHQRCPTPNAVISASIPHYHPPDRLQDCRNHLLCMYVQAFNHTHPLHLNGHFLPVETIKPMAPMLSAFVLACFIFAPAIVCKNVPNDPHIYFRGDESTFALRLWTHGYDIYQPDSVIIYHYWDRVARSNQTPEDEYKTVKGNKRAELSQARMQHILGLKLSDDPQVLIDLERYGLGSVRPAKDFWAFAGIDPVSCILDEKAKRGMWTPYLAHKG